MTDETYYCLWSHEWRPAPCNHLRCQSAGFAPLIEGQDTGSTTPIAQGEGVPVHRPPKFRRFRYMLNTRRRRQS